MMLRVRVLVALLASAAAEPSDCQASSFDSETRDAIGSLLQTTAEGASKLQGSLHEEANGMQQFSITPECIAIAAAAAAYRFDNTTYGFVSMGNRTAQMLVALGYTFVKKHSITSESGDHDYVGLWTKDGACLVNFKGSEHGDDIMNNHNSTPMTKWGLPGVHSGLVAELEPLVNMMDFEAIRGMCTGPLTVVGHSLGGGLAQLFALAINNPADPLGAKLTVDFLYAFGPMPVSVNELPNPAADDGCFAGGIYLDSLKLKDGTVQADTLLDHSWGGMLPVRTTKTLQFGQGTAPMVYGCATPIPKTIDPVDGTDVMQFYNMHYTGSYLSFMGCLE